MHKILCEMTLGPTSPPSFKGHQFILTPTNFFSKQAEAIPMKEVKMTDVIKFFKHYVIHHFGVPCRIIYDNGP